jgi:ABC-type Fe3+ transport system substrate-binding protein
MKRPGTIVAAASVATLLLVAACAAPAAAPRQAPANAPVAAEQPATAHPPALQAVIDAARQEGTLDLVWGEGVVGGREGASRLAEGLNRQYGLNLDVRFTPGPSFVELVARLTQEQQAGRRATTDVFIGADNHMGELGANGVLEPVDWSAWALNVRDPALVGPGGMAVSFQSWVPGITYNSTRVSGAAVPRTLQDLLKPEYKGRVASTPYASNFDRLALPAMWGKARTMEFATQFADQLGGLIRCNETSRIANGEFDLLALDCNQANALAAKANGAPVDFTPATDVPVVALVYMAVPRHAAHPAAAKLWIDHMLSREAQDILYAVDYMDSHLVPGSHTAREVDKLRAGGAPLQTFDIARLQSGEEALRAEVLPDIQRVFAKQ